MAAEERTSVRALVSAARPLQWTKNVFVFAGILFSVSIDEPRAWALTLLTFGAFCAASSAAYLVNDVLDAEEDRAHPVKRRRPIASGQLDPRVALVAAATLAVAAAALAVPVGWEVVALTLGFLGLQLAYSLRLKHIVLLDVIVISILFVLRAAAGGGERWRRSVSGDGSCGKGMGMG